MKSRLLKKQLIRGLAPSSPSPIGFNPKQSLCLTTKKEDFVLSFKLVS
jgi:hypothetical protein